MVFNNMNVSKNKCNTIPCKEPRPKTTFLRQFPSNIHPKKEHDDYVGKDQSVHSIFIKSFQTNKSYLYMTSDKSNVGAMPRHRSSEGSITLPKQPLSKPIGHFFFHIFFMFSGADLVLTNTQNIFKALTRVPEDK